MICAACVANAANYLTFTAEEDSSSFGIVNFGNNPDVQYSLDDGATWTALAEGDTVVLVHKGDKALLKGVNPEGVSRDGQRSTFTMTGKVAASGSLMSLIDGTGLATEIPGYDCFCHLFIGCTSLTKAPELSATTLAGGCYEYMFYGCTNLSEIRASFDEWERGTTSCWVRNVAPTGTFICPKALALEYGEDRIPEGWTVQYIDDTVAVETNYLTFTAEEDNSTFGIKNTNNEPDVQYSLDGGKTWTALADGDSVVLAKKGDKALLKGNNPKGFSQGFMKYTQFVMSGSISASGSVMSLIDGVGLSVAIPCDYCFHSMFSGCASLTQAPELPATTLAFRCYYYMFLNCTSLTQTPELPATTLVNRCYEYMFRGCTSLTRALALPATTLTEYCYDGMFIGCTSLTEAPELPATTLAEHCYDNMFSGCTSLTQAPELPAMTLVSDCYPYMFKGCTSLAQAPELPATTLADRCYYSMFWECTSLTQAPELPATTLAGHCYAYMFKECTSLTQAPELPATTLALRCYEQMFSGCTSLTQVSVLPATTLDSYCYVYMFSGCTSLTKAPALPAKTLDSYCYIYMFSGCTSLTKAPELPATTLDSCCYAYMFSGCTSLTQTPELPATTLADRCYYSMFKGCTGLMRASELPATTLASGCYSAMFSDCTSLTQAPALPATTLAEDCYYSMFSGCTSLTQAPNLLATTLANNCYYSMFSGCTSLTKAPKLLATDLPIPSGKSSCCGSMFSGCTNLSEISVAFNEWNDNTFEWVKDVAPAGTFICPEDLPVRYGMSRIPRGWAAKNIIDGDTVDVPINYNYLTFTAEEDGSTFGIDCYLLEADVQYSLDGGNTWTKLALGDTVVLAQKGDKALIRGYNEYSLGENTKDYVHFVMTGAIAASGSVMSLIDEIGLSKEIPRSSYFFQRLFINCTSLTQAPELPATTLSDACYCGMFSGCTGLTQAPELPATALASYCYWYMFSGCTGLTKAPELPATTTSVWCYDEMFSGCTNMSEIKVSFDDWSSQYPTIDWVKDVAPTGTFICPKELPLEYGVSRIPEGWTVKYIEDMANYLTFTAEEDGSTFGIVNGRNSPNVLYSLDGGKTWTFLAEGDTVRLAHKGDKALLKGNNPQGFSRNYMEYQSSFKMTGKIAASGSVMSLIDGTGLSSEIRGVDCFGSLFENCTSLTQAPELPATTLTEDCYAHMFRGCTSLMRAPELPATTLAQYCYWEMFSGCTSLTQAPELPATTLTEDCYAYMFRGCTSLTKAPALIATTLAEACYYEMFRGCTGLTQAPALPATTLAEYCYSDMFSSCTSLTEAPELPATTLANNCYYSMFSGCTSLTKAPNLPATELPAPVNKNSCYGSMFSNCTNLSEISVAFNVWDDNTFWWVKNVAPTGTFICPKELPLEYGDSKIPEGWTVKYPEDVSVADPALADGITVWTDGLTVYVCGAEGEVSLYDMSGRIVAVSNSKDEERVLGVPAKGAYVVRMNGGSSVLLVR